MGYQGDRWLSVKASTAVEVHWGSSGVSLSGPLPFARTSFYGSRRFIGLQKGWILVHGYPREVLLGAGVCFCIALLERDCAIIIEGFGLVS